MSDDVGAAMMPPMETTMTTATRKIGTNRGNRRAWIEGDILAHAGWARGIRYTRTVTAEAIVLVRDDAGARKVAGTPSRPIVDLCGAWVTTWAAGAETFTVTAAPSSVIISRNA